MVTTGWIGEEPEAAGPDLPVTNMLRRMRQRSPGDTVALALARSDAADARAAREEAAAARDPDEYAAVLVTRGYSPGLLRSLSEQLGDVTAELEAEREKIEKGARRAAHIHRAHEAGRLDAFGVMRMLDFDEGDEGKARQLERRAQGLRDQIAEAQDAVTPPSRRREDPVEAATRRAHEAFLEATRAKWAEVQDQSRPATAPRRARRPFAGRGGFAVRSEVTCPECIAAGATPDESFLLHSDPQPVSLPEDAQPVPVPGGAVPYCRGCGALSEWCTCNAAAGRAGSLWNPGQEIRRGNLAGAL